MFPQGLQPTTAETLAAILGGLSSPDNAVRSLAERDLHANWILQNQEQFLLGLVALIGNHHDNQVHALALQEYSLLLTI